jgi:hypothetical protein
MKVVIGEDKIQVMTKDPNGSGHNEEIFGVT